MEGTRKTMITLNKDNWYPGRNSSRIFPNISPKRYRLSYPARCPTVLLLLLHVYGQRCTKLSEMPLSRQRGESNVLEKCLYLINTHRLIFKHKLVFVLTVLRGYDTAHAMFGRMVHMYSQIRHAKRYPLRVNVPRFD
jgi:hypothetical protein